MKANLILDNVKAYDITKFDIRNGENCFVELEDVATPVRWFSDSDQVLSITTTGEGAQIKALAKGVSEIQLQSEGVIVKTLYVEVYDNIAASLNPVAGSPELK